MKVEVMVYMFWIYVVFYDDLIVFVVVNEIVFVGKQMVENEMLGVLNNLEFGIFEELLL